VTDEADETWPSKELRARASQQAHVLRDSAAEGGLRFQAYLPPELALWILDRIEQGVFTDPSEAVFVLLDEARELEPHQDLRQDLLKRRILSAANDPCPGVAFDEFLGKLEATQKIPRPEPTVWLPIEDKGTSKNCPEPCTAV
jgi:Arc/MetJ-type ribon-helix-helix transcriptional regulator